jgi:hypothetical protein
MAGPNRSIDLGQLLVTRPGGIRFPKEISRVNAMSQTDYKHILMMAGGAMALAIVALGILSSM